MKKWLNLLGWPYTHKTKKNRLFNQDFTRFCRTNNISNTSITDKGVAQTAIRSVKQLLLKCKLEDEDYQTALANMREATTESGSSARHILMGAGQWTTQPDLDKGEEHMDEEKATKKQEANQDNLETGDRVLIKHQTTGHWNKEAEIIEQREDKLSYVIRRNRTDPSTRKETAQTKTRASYATQHGQTNGQTGSKKTRRFIPHSTTTTTPVKTYTHLHTIPNTRQHNISQHTVIIQGKNKISRELIHRRFQQRRQQPLRKLQKQQEHHHHLGIGS